MGRKSRGLRRFDDLRVSWLDLKLGFRMLVRYPGLTLVGGLAIAFGIASGSVAFEVVNQIVRPSLPLPDGDRVVGIQNWDAASGRVSKQVLHDFVAWRDQLRSVRELGAFRTVQRNLITGEGRGAPVDVAELSASAFRLVRIPPLLGRALVDADERPDAPQVVVLGYETWQTRFASDSGIVGRPVRLGSAEHVVVGVMPEGFAFPVNHGLWTPLRVDPLQFRRGQGPAIGVFGRLAAGASIADAQAELAALGSRMAVEFPDTHEHLRPQVLPYARSVSPLPEVGSTGLLAVDVFLVMLLVLVSGNVALLMFARAAARESEIVVRTALGASRIRIVAQLFGEALVLAGVAAVAGTAAAGFGLRMLVGVLEAEAGGRLPLWFSDRLSPATLLYAALLAVLGAMITGVLPGLKVTRALAARLRQAAAGGAGLQFGGIWTAVIISQVAVTVAFPATAFFAGRFVVQMQSVDVGFPEAEYLSVRLEIDREPPPSLPDAAPRGDTSVAQYRARFVTVARELERRLEGEPGVLGITFVDRLPRTFHPARRVELDDAAVVPDTQSSWQVSSAVIDADYFDVLDAPVLAGRGFRAGDLEPNARVVVVNQTFVQQVLGGRNALGRRVRYQNPDDPSTPAAPGAKPGPWYEIVGVARDLGMVANDPANAPGIYFAAAPGMASPVQMVVHVRGDPRSFAARLRSAATAVDPALRLHDILPMNQVGATMWTEMAFLFRVLLVVSSMALLLSLAGIYSVMAFTVARRTREIGVRVALGSTPRRIVTTIFARPLRQVALGLVAGAVLVVLLTQAVMGLSVKEVAVVIAYMVLMMAVCLIACIVPTRRALRVEPMTALRTE